MKNFKKLNILVLLAAIAIVFAACGDDDDDDDTSTPKTNEIVVNGTSYPLSSGVIINYGETDPGVYNLDLSFFSDGITVVETGGMIDSAYGTGNILYFEMFANIATDIPAGSYGFDTVNMGAGTFDYADYAINIDVEDPNGVYDEIYGGNVTVAKDGNTYEVNYSGTDENGKTVTAYYKGTLKYYDDSSKKSPKRLR